ncbi:hypothetical protein Taro_035783, partial [Colocasia esculenta]|nr:hypothetical protein [Colocasia esculenta]
MGKLHQCPEFPLVDEGRWKTHQITRSKLLKFGFSHRKPYVSQESKRPNLMENKVFYGVKVSGYALSVDTRSKQVDTSPRLQKTQLPDWDSRSTLAQSRSYKPSFQEEDQGNQGGSLEKRLLFKAREQIQLKRLRRRRISGISDAIKAEHRQLRRISIDFHQASSI